MPVTAAGEVSIAVEIPTEELPNGFHTLFVRFRDSQGSWGMSEGRTFLVEQQRQTAASVTITKAEYFFNTDPGIGKGRSLPVTAAGQVNVVTEIATEGLANGFHTLFVRFRDQQGNWSLSEGRTFLLEQRQSTSNTYIVKAEYFIDSDPGAGKGEKIAVAPSEQVDLVAEIAINELAHGFHTLYTRVLDNAGNWSLAEGRPFFTDKSVESFATIVAAEYFFDDANPEPGKGIPLVFEPGSHLTLEEQIDLRGLALGKHRLHLRMRDDKGVWSHTEIKEFTVANPRLDEITPVAGGNVGDVTVNIVGASFDKGTKVKLTRSGHPDIIVPDSMMAINRGEQIQALFDLRGKAVGEYNIVATLANGTELTIPNGFSILEGVKAHPWADVIGFDRIRRGQWQTYTVTYGNKGNVDATGVPLWIQIPADSEYELDFELYKPESSTILWDTIPDSYITDTIMGVPERARIIPLVIPHMAPGELGTLTFKLKTDNNESFVVSAWASPPMYRSPLDPKTIDCYADVAAAVAGLIPGVGCAYSFLDIAIRPMFKKATTGIDGWFSGDSGLHDSNGKPKAGSFFASVAFATAGCIPGGRLIGTVGKVVSGMAAAGHVNNGMNAVLSCRDPFLPPEYPKKNKPVQPVASFDPNDKLGLEGAGMKNYITGNEIFPYLIRFENKASATAAAQTVLIIDTLDTNTLDISTLQLGFFSFDDVVVNIPPGRKNYTADVDLRPKNDLIVRIEANLDEQKGILTWLYTSLDPRTLRPTEDPDAGFLPPNKTAPQGDGGVFFTIRPKADLSTNADIKNMAYIYFDNNEVIPTPVWVNAIDKTPPVSKVNELAAVQTSSEFTVSWSGTDEGSGVATYSIYVAVNDQPYKLWLDKVPTTSAVFTGKQDSTYHFYSIATDSAGYVEAVPAVAHASTTMAIVTGIEADIEKQVVVYPNPAYHTLIVELPALLRKSNLSLINMHGAVVFQQQAEDTSTSIPVSQVAKGMYLLRISTENYVITRKVMIR
ncbi:T9SS type A sorting domain-containing protein [Pontibacter sp. 13R65]|uniref:T9SS type A sorting domain-containing protein n=1 Tax=Pontibacter sp. 13R65 TaxID=3127458 RepID=UPI00301C287A